MGKGEQSAEPSPTDVEAAGNDVLEAKEQIIKPAAKGKDLVFKDIRVEIGGKKILHGVSGMAKQGTMLAVMGPSGAGKSTLMNSLLLRMPMTSGHVTLDGEVVTRRHCRKIAYCIQNDVFFPGLTLKETLNFRAELSLPETMAKAEKAARIEDVTNILDLQECLNTPMGGIFMPGLSGGQKRRASIACELLNDPQVMILDEPTSGLDSAIAYSIMHLLETHTVKSNKTILASIHQPSSQIFHMFKWLLLIADGQVAYFGKVDRLVSHLENIGLHCHLHFNPADFILEKVKDEKSRSIVLSEESSKLQRSHWPPELTKDLSIESPKEKSADHVEVTIAEENGVVTLGYISKEDGAIQIGENIESVAIVPEQDKESKWPTGFISQYKTLTRRHLQLNKGNVFNRFKFIKIIALTFYTAVAWWQSARTEENLESKFGLSFFPPSFFMFEFFVDAVSSFMPERGVVQRERASGLYRLSSYYLAKMTSELPTVFVFPGIFIAVTYWACALTATPGNFFAYTSILWLHCLTTQSLGFLIAVVFDDIRACLSMTALAILPGLLASGFLARNLPSWVVWIQYGVHTQYTIRSLNQLEFEYGDLIRCAPPNMTTFQYCKQEVNETLYIPRDMVLNKMNTPLPFWANISVLFAFSFGLRILGYVAMRLLRKPVKKKA